jgi:hypothetical protein
LGNYGVKQIDLEGGLSSYDLTELKAFLSLSREVLFNLSFILRMNIALLESLGGFIGSI